MRRSRTATPFGPTAPLLLVSLTALAAIAPTPARAAETLARIDWETVSIADADGLDVSVAQAPGGAPSLRVRGGAARPATLPLWRHEAPPVSGPAYALAGRLRHKGVEGNAYLEMWSHFSDGGAFFSRTLAVAGPLRSLSGDSDWRQVLIPFELGDSPLQPRLLELNLHLPAGGEVEIGPLSLIQYLPGENPLGAAAAGAGETVGTNEARALTAGIAVVAGATLLSIVIVIARRRRSAVRSELRKIQALDAS